MMPFEYTAMKSIRDARELAKNIGVKYHEIPIHELYACYEKSLQI